MANPLYQSMGTNGIFQQIQSLKQQMGGNPQEHIQRLLNSGKVSQAQYNAAVQKAEQIRKLMER